MRYDKIFLACPYSDDDPLIREKRCHIASRVAGHFIKLGFIVYSPISHSHPIALVTKLPIDASYWERHNRSMIEWADHILVCNIKGWTLSKGVKAEIRLAKSLHKPIHFAFDRRSKLETENRRDRNSGQSPKKDLLPIETG